MNCEEFRALNATDADLWNMTPIERARCGNHYLHCPLCQIWVYLQPPDNGTSGPKDAAELCHRDLQNPTVREIMLEGDE